MKASYFIIETFDGMSAFLGTNGPVKDIRNAYVFTEERLHDVKELLSELVIKTLLQSEKQVSFIIFTYLSNQKVYEASNYWTVDTELQLNLILVDAN